MLRAKDFKSGNLLSSLRWSQSFNPYALVSSQYFNNGKNQLTKNLAVPQTDTELPYDPEILLIPRKNENINPHKNWYMDIYRSIVYNI